MHRRKRNGFTLVELLVVIAIISLLAGLLLPVLEDALESARTVECLSRLKQFMMANLMYVDDNGGWMPMGANHAFLQLPKGGYLPSTGEFNDTWYTSPACLADSCPVMYCPLMPICPPLYNLPVPYAIREYPSGIPYYYLYGNKVKVRKYLDEPLKETDYTHSQFLMWGEACNKQGTYPVSVIYMTGGNPINLRHNGRGTAAFADGHVDCVREDEVYSEYGINGCYVGTDNFLF